MEKPAQNEEAAKSNDIDPMIDEEEPNFSDPEEYVDDITDEGNLPLICFSLFGNKDMSAFATREPSELYPLYHVQSILCDTYESRMPLAINYSPFRVILRDIKYHIGNYFYSTPIVNVI